MRILRLRLSNYKGIEETDIRFQVNGLTIIEGPNETGKSTVAEAINILLDNYDNSRSSDVLATKPVDKDVGTEIEIEIQSGPYEFVYFKRFHKRQETKLTITKPKTENHTGRNAHDRVKTILNETIDVNLWHALNIHQGEGINQANLSKSTSLSLALDAAAGGQSTDSRDETLFSIIRKEYLKYYTDSAKEKKELQEIKKNVDRKHLEVQDLQDQVQTFEEDIKNIDILQQKSSSNEEAETKLVTTLSQHEEEYKGIKLLQSEIETSQLKLGSAQKTENSAKRDYKERQDLIVLIKEIGASLSKLNEQNNFLTVSYKETEELVNQAKEIVDKKQEHVKDLENTLNTRRNDFNYYNNRLHLEQLIERKERIDKADEKARNAEEYLNQIKIDDVKLKEIQEADRNLAIEVAQLKAGTPSLLLQALKDLELTIDDMNVEIEKNTEKIISVVNEIRINIPQIVEIRVTPGLSTNELTRKVSNAEKALKKLCQDLDVKNADEAKEVNERRLQALRDVEYKKGIEKENLRDLTYEEMEKKILELDSIVSLYLENRSAHPPISSNLDSAKKELDNAEILFGNLRNTLEDNKKDLGNAIKKKEEMTQENSDLQAQLTVKGEELKREEEKLSISRGQFSDEDLKKSLENAETEVNKLERILNNANEELKKRGLQEVEELVETTKQSLLNLREQQERIQDELTDTRARLKVLGEQGLYEKLQIEKSHLENLVEQKDVMSRRAEASKVLYDIINDERDKVRRAYLNPLKDKIEQMGCLLFNETFKVELSEDLMITSRTINGKTIPYNLLSGGAQEQLSLITRLACAMIISKDNGAPLILDDALGYTDPERIELISKILSEASKECQMIVLTCVPDRYKNVKNANLIPFTQRVI